MMKDERKTKEQLITELNDLRQERDFAESLIETAQVIVLVLDTQGKIVRFNPYMEDVSGYRLEEVRGKDWFTTFLPRRDQDRIRKLFLKAAGDVQTRGNVNPIVTKDGRERQVEWYDKTLKDADGNVVGVLAVGQDATERVRAEEELEKHREHLQELVEERTAQLNQRVAEVEQLNQAMVNLMEDLQAANQNLQATAIRLQEVNQELNDFAYVVSHDLKAPLRGIIQLAGWLAEDYGHALDDEGRKLVELLIGRTRRMNNLIEGILQYSRVGRVRERKKKVDLNQLLEETIDSLAPPEHIQITIQDDLPTVTGEQTRLRQVFQNLLSNAIKFMDKPRGLITIGCADNEDYWLFNVTDNGLGIEERYHDKVFQIFQTLSPRDEVEGTGVGLAVVKKIVEVRGGHIWLESTPGEGSTFYFTLPKNAEEQ